MFVNLKNWIGTSGSIQENVIGKDAQNMNKQANPMNSKADTFVRLHLQRMFIRRVSFSYLQCLPRPEVPF